MPIVPGEGVRHDRLLGEELFDGDDGGSGDLVVAAEREPFICCSLDQDRAYLLVQEVGVGDSRPAIGVASVTEQVFPATRSEECVVLLL